MISYSIANALNNRYGAESKVDDSQGNGRAFVYNGFEMSDLNWVNPDRRFVLEDATGINEQNEIIGLARNVSTGHVDRPASGW